MKQIGEEQNRADARTRSEYYGWRDAFGSVAPERKVYAYKLLGAAAVTFAVLLLSRLIWLFKPLFHKMYTGQLATPFFIFIYYGVIAVVFAVYVVFLDKYLKRSCDLKLFSPFKTELSLHKILAIAAVGAVTVFIAGASFKFRTKIQLEMGVSVNMTEALANLLVYAYYALHLWLGLISATLIQRALTVLIPSKYSLPWGSVFLVAVFGLVELVLELYGTPNMFPWMYFLFTFAYAFIFEISEHRFHVTYWACVLILVL